MDAGFAFDPGKLNFEEWLQILLEREKELVNWPMLREDLDKVIFFSGAKKLKELVDKVHDMGYLIVGNHLSTSLSPGLVVGSSQSANFLVAPGLLGPGYLNQEGGGHVRLLPATLLRLPCQQLPVSLR